MTMILVKIVEGMNTKPYTDARIDLGYSPAAFFCHNSYSRMFDTKIIDSLKSSRKLG